MLISWLSYKTVTGKRNKLEISQDKYNVTRTTIPSGQKYYSGLPRPPPGDLPNGGIEPIRIMSPAFAIVLPGKPMLCYDQLCSRVQLYVTLWTVAHQAPQSIGILQARIPQGLPSPPPEEARIYTQIWLFCFVSIYKIKMQFTLQFKVNPQIFSN